MNQINLKETNREASFLVDDLFYNKIVKLEEISNVASTLAKQMQLKKLKDDVVSFIERNPNSMFEIRLLKKNHEDPEDFLIAIAFPNFKVEEKETRISRFVITIDYNFNSINYYEWSINKILIKI